MGLRAREQRKSIKEVAALAAIMEPNGPAFEVHYSVGQLASLWNMGRETVRLLVKDEPGVLKIRQGRKKERSSYSIPTSVATRIHTRLSASARRP